MKDIGHRQIKLIKIARKYILNLEKKGINTAISSASYMQTFGESPGYVKLKKFNNNSNFSEFICFLKSFLSITNISQVKLLENNSLQKYKYLFISFADESDFSSSGKYIDRYFNIGSEKKNILWFLVYMGNKYPKKVDKNVLILFRKKKTFSLNIFFLIKYCFFLIKKNKFNFYNTCHQLSQQSCFAYLVNKIIENKIDFKNIKKIFIPFESQPFQNLIIQNFKKKNKNLKVVGYDHSIDALPINNMYKKYSPDILYVHSNNQKKFYSNYLYWPAKKVVHISSTRFPKRKNYFFDQKIFLPNNISIKNELIKNLEFFLQQKFTNKIKPLKVKIHPFSQKSKKHMGVKNEILLILKKYKNSFSSKSKQKISIFLGATSSVIEALENGCKVVHIVSDPVFESYSNKLWPSLKIKKISENIFQYSLKTNSRCLTLRGRKNFVNDLELQ